MSSTDRTFVFICTFILLISLSCLTGLAAEPRTLAQPTPGNAKADSMVEWERLFLANGQLRDSIGPGGSSQPNGVPDVLDLGGYDAVFVQEWVAAQQISEATASTQSVKEAGFASVDREVNNAYLFSRPDAHGNLVVQIGADRISSGQEGFIEFELNQRIYRLQESERCDSASDGLCRFRRGQRTVGDLMVRLDVGADDSLLSGVVSKWVGEAGFQELAYLTDEGCLSGDDLCVRITRKSVRGSFGRGRDHRGPAPQENPAKGLIEVNLNVGALLGFNPCLSNFQVRTAGDYGLGYFDSCLGGDYDIDLAGAIPGSYLAVSPRDLPCPASVNGNGEVGFGGRASSAFSGADFDVREHRKSIISTESFSPGQIVPFRFLIEADEKAHPGSVVDLTAEWRDAISEIPFSRDYSLYCAFVADQQPNRNSSGDIDARVEAFSGELTESGLIGSLRVSGVDSGEAIAVEAWLVLEEGTAEPGPWEREDASLISSKMRDATASGSIPDPERIHEADIALSIQNGCLEDNSTHSGLSCSASDVEIARVVGVNVHQGCSFPGAEAIFDLTVELVARNQRYDVGIYMARDGGDARTGACIVESLPVPGFPAIDSDSCGDINPASCPETEPCTFTIPDISAACIDPDGDGLLELASCLSWDQNQGGTCNSPEDVAPGSPSKCRCDILDIDEIRIPPEISVEKTADPIVIPETGGNVTFTFVVENKAIADVTLNSLVDDVLGDLNGQGTCLLPQTLAASGGSYTCAVIAFLQGAADSFHRNVVTASASNDDGTTEKTDDAEVAFEDVLPDISVTKTANPTSVLEVGGDVTFTFEVVNNSLEEAQLDSLTDSVFGDLDGQGDCSLPQTLAGGGGTYTCSVTLHISGEPTDSHTNVVTATASDNDGNTDTDSDDAVVDFEDVMPDISLTKSADPTIVLETGADVEFTFTVTNHSLEQATLDSLTDSVFGDLNGQGSCSTGGVLDPGGGQYSCSVTVFIQGDADEVHTNVATATASDNDGNSDTDSDDAEVTILNADPIIDVDKSADPSEVLTTGGWVTYTITITNQSAPSDPVTITSVTDEVWTDHDGNGEIDDGELETLDYASIPGSDCGTLLGTVLQAGESSSCTYTLWIAGPAWIDPRNTVTVVGEDDEASTDTDSDTAQVNLAYMAWTPGFWKNHAKGKHNAWDYCLAYDTETLVADVFSSEALNLAPVQITGRKIRVSDVSFAELTLLEALRLQGGDGIPGAIEILLRAATATLLNACYHESVGNDIGEPDDIFPVTTSDVIAGTNGALDSGDRGSIIGLAGVYDSYNNGIGEFDWTQPIP